MFGRAPSSSGNACQGDKSGGILGTFMWPGCWGLQPLACLISESFDQEATRDSTIVLIVGKSSIRARGLPNTALQLVGPQAPWGGGGGEGSPPLGRSAESTSSLQAMLPRERRARLSSAPPAHASQIAPSAQATVEGGQGRKGPGGLLTGLPQPARKHQPRRRGVPPNPGERRWGTGSWRR